MFYKKTYCHPVQVDFDLLDAGGVVHHPNYLVLCERARTAALAEVGYSFFDLWNEGLSLAVVEANLNYFRPALPQQNLVILSRTVEFSGVSASIVQEMVDFDQLKISSPELRSGFHSHPGEIKKESLVFSCKMKLVCVKLKPFGVGRIPRKMLDLLSNE